MDPTKDVSRVEYEPRSAIGVNDNEDREIIDPILSVLPLS